MNQNQAAAYTMGQAACVMVEVAAMQAENQRRLSLGQSIAYGEANFQALFRQYSVDHNSVLSLYENAERT
jgi:hypothetical protein